MARFFRFLSVSGCQGWSSRLSAPLPPARGLVFVDGSNIGVAAREDAEDTEDPELSDEVSWSTFPPAPGWEWLWWLRWKTFETRLVMEFNRDLVSCSFGICSCCCCWVSVASPGGLS